MPDQPVIILGINGNCIDIAEAVEASQGLEVAGYLDDDPNVPIGAEIAGYSLLGRLSDAQNFPTAKFVCGIGSPRSFQMKPEIIQRTRIPEDRWATIVHPTCVISRHAHIGYGSVLLSQVAVGADAKIGSHCTVLQGSIISHHSLLEDYVVAAGGVCISGSCHIEFNAYLGSRTTLRDGIRIGRRTLIGAGSVVVRSIPANQVAFGNPARLRR